MKICFINNLYGPKARGGAEKVIKNLADFLISRGHQVTVIAGANQNKTTKEPFEGTRLILVSSKYDLLKNFSQIRKLFFHIFSFFNLAGALRIKKIVKENNFDLVWTNNLVGLNLLTLAVLGKIKKIHTFHDLQLLHPSGLMFYGQENILDSLSAKIYQWFSRKVLATDVLGIFPSNWLKEMYIKYKLLPKNNLVLSNPTTDNTDIKVDNKDINNNFTFLYVGQIEEHKGIDLLIKAFNELNLSEAKLMIAGEGSILNSLEKNNTNNNITFLGKVDHISNLMLKADCLVIPSICYENMPMVLVEANQANLAVIGSNLGGLVEAIADERLLFTPTLEDLKNKLSWCFSNQEDLKKAAELMRQKNKNISLEEYFKKISEALGVNL